MNEQDLYDGITHVKSRYIQEAASATPKKKKLPMGILAVAACLCLVAASSFLWLTPPATSGTPAEPQAPGEVVPLSSATVNLLADVTTTSATPLPASDATLLGTTKDIANFSMDLFRQEYIGNNLVISPLSIVSALTMAGNGAAGETKSQMETMLHRDIDIMNQYLYSYRTWLPTSVLCTVSTANSIWYRDTNSLAMVPEFLETNQSYHSGDLYKAPFNDQTVKDINNWVSKETDGEIQKILEAPIEDSTMIYLINALSFDGKWSEKYEDRDVKKGTFTRQDGTKETAEFMYSKERDYLTLEGATGFAKDYAEGAYSFVGILPDGDLDDFLANLQGEALIDALWNRESTDVSVAIPQFTTGSNLRLRTALETIGMTDAFSMDLANFSQMATSEEGNLHLDDVIHQTTITVGQNGTKAGAVTVIPEKAEAEEPAPSPKVVTLDRPFLFLIVDNTVHLPVFMGTINTIN